MMPSPVWTACCEELLKISAAHARVTVPKTRIGRRPLRVDTLLRKEKDGTLYKKAGAMTSTGSSDGGPAVVPYEEAPTKGLPAKPKKRKWEVPSVDDQALNNDRLDGRDHVVTQVGPGVSMGSTGIAHTNSGVG